MLPPLVTGIGLIVLGLGGGCVGLFVPLLIRLTAPASGDQPGRRWPEARVWLVAWAMMGLGLVGFGVSELRHAQGQYVIVPASAPLLERVIWVGSFVCAFSGLAVCVVWMLVQSVRDMRARREHPGGS